MLGTHDAIMRARDFKLFLHSHLLNDESNILILNRYMEEEFDTLSSSYNSNTFSYEIKVKKTNMKKNPNFSHTPNYYYSVLNSVLFKFFNDAEINNKIKSVIMLYDKSGQLATFYNDILSGDITSISLLYMITPIPDNSIIIYL